ncbi:MAG: hypothetical protein AB7H71_08285 [Alphaproteobacteria bacterium]
MIEASRAITFNHVGYPTHINAVEELWRYADVMQENRLRGTFDAIGGLTDREFELVERVTKTVAELTQELCGHRVIPGASLIRAIPVYRAIKQVIPNGGSVFELGPGSGYVGALAIADGYRYGATDISQAFVLWQQHLFKALKPAQPVEQIMWWDWMLLMSPPVYDVFTANHALNEMHAHALIHAVRVAKEMLAGKGVFLVENFGSTALRPTELTRSVFQAIGQPVTEIGAGRLNANPTRQWADMETMWQAYGGVPQSPDEKYLAWLGVNMT